MSLLLTTSADDDVVLTHVIYSQLGIHCQQSLYTRVRSQYIAAQKPLGAAAKGTAPHEQALTFALTITAPLAAPNGVLLSLCCQVHTQL